jgi:hypothetical protein
MEEKELELVGVPIAMLDPMLCMFGKLGVVGANEALDGELMVESGMDTKGRSGITASGLNLGRCSLALIRISRVWKTENMSSWIWC